MLVLFLFIFVLKANLSPKDDVPCDVYDCQLCDAENNCIKCNEKYGLKKENGKNVCSRCIGDCTECYENYLICEKCSKGPLISPGMCGKCDVGYGYLNGNCEPEPKNCYHYNIIDGAFKCDECIHGYYPYDNDYSNCVPCSTEYCSYCDAPLDQCYSCEIGYTLIKDNDAGTRECKKCLESNCNKCGDDISFCSDCIEGYGMVLDDNKQETGKCEKCIDPKCRDCSKNYLICEEKKNIGYGTIYGIDENGKVVPCPDGCHCTNATYCMGCDSYYYGEVLTSDGTFTGQCNKCTEYCSECNRNATDCRSCIINATSITSEGSTKCVLNPINSYGFSQDNKIDCKFNYGVLIDKNGNSLNVCSKCPPNCFSCNENSNFCTKCQNGYGPVLDKNGKNLGICEKCAGLCDHCDNDYTKCSECGYSDTRSGIYFGKEIDENGIFTGNCVKCGENCKRCNENAKICERCNSGYTLLLDENGDSIGECTKCTVPYCKYCDDDPGVCSTCDDGADLILDENGDSTGKCKKCPNNCKGCEESICDSCNSNQGLVLDENGEPTGECRTCIGQNCLYCKYDYRKCSNCMEGFQPILGPDGKPTSDCAKCPDNCEYCQGNANVCLSCTPGYGKQNDTESGTVKCAKCPDNCLICENYQMCSRCAEGYNLEKDEDGMKTGRCIKIDENCYMYADNGKFCTQCNSNYALKITVTNGVATSECIKCHDSCMECDPENPTKCIYCNSGYRRIFEEKDPTKMCKKCIDNCKECNDDTTCESCMTGFGVNEELTCSECVDTNCIECPYDSKYCRMCKDGFNLVSGVCRTCPENCKDCTYDVNLCSICDDGYGFEINNEGKRTGKCLKCGENCESCASNSNLCELCKDGFGFEFDASGKQTKNCKQCDEHCIHCYINADECVQCDIGFGLIANQDGTSSGKCGSCPENCLNCDFDNSICTECQSGFGLVVTEKDGNKAIHCSACPENCQNCNYDTSTCLICSQNEDKPYGFEVAEDGSFLNNCVECPSNCKRCYSSKKCDECKEGYVEHYSLGFVTTCHPIGDQNDSFDNLTTTSPDISECLVDGCVLCEEGFTDQCAKCNSSLVLTQKKQCVKPLVDITTKPTPEPVKVDISNCSVESENLNCNFDNVDLGDAKHIMLQLDPKNQEENKISSVTIENTKNNTVVVQILDGFEEITFKVGENTNDKSFSIIPASKSPLTIKLDPSTHASIIEAEGEISIESTEDDKPVNLNQVKPKSDLKITPKGSIIIDEVEFSEKNTEFTVNSDDNKKVKINSIKIQQLKSGKIQNATILEKITIGLSSSLEINENVKLDNSIVELSYNNEYSQLIEDVAHIKGIINSTPKKIVISERNENEWLSENEKLLIVESENEFDCQSWGNKIEYTKPFGQFQCEKTVPYRLYAVQKDKKDDEGNKLSTGAIVGIVVGVVVFVALIVFLLVYFLVIKKKRNISTVSENEDISVQF